MLFGQKLTPVLRSVIQDSIISNDQKLTRDTANQKVNDKLKVDYTPVDKGDLVQLKANPKKHTVRETYLVTDTQDTNVKVQKLTNLYSHTKAQLRSKEYELKKCNIQKLTGKMSSNGNHSSSPYKNNVKCKTKKALYSKGLHQKHQLNS